LGQSEHVTIVLKRQDRELYFLALLEKNALKDLFSNDVSFLVARSSKNAFYVCETLYSNQQRHLPEIRNIQCFSGKEV